jgi:uncharacterized protein YkwD
MKRFTSHTLIAAALVVLPAVASKPAYAATQPPSPATTPNSSMASPNSSMASPNSSMASAAYEAEVVRLTNVERNANGCASLRVDDRLTIAARAHSADMVAARYFSHTGSDGSNFVAREVAAGYPRRGASAENIAWGYRTPKDVVSGWMHSPGHRANILDCGSVAVGVGLAYNAGGAPYWTQDFGRS